METITIRDITSGDTHTIPASTLALPAGYLDDADAACVAGEFLGEPSEIGMWSAGEAALVRDVADNRDDDGRPMWWLAVVLATDDQIRAHEPRTTEEARLGAAALDGNDDARWEISVLIRARAA